MNWQFVFWFSVWHRKGQAWRVFCGVSMFPWLLTGPQRSAGAVMQPQRGVFIKEEASSIYMRLRRRKQFDLHGVAVFLNLCMLISNRFIENFGLGWKRQQLNFISLWLSNQTSIKIACTYCSNLSVFLCCFAPSILSGSRLHHCGGLFVGQ